MQLNEELEKTIKGCCKGDRKAQEWLHKRFYSTLFPVCMRYTNNIDQAEDILQNGFIKVFKNIKKYKFEGSFEGWIKRIVVNTAIDYHRKRKKDFVLLPEDQEMEQFEMVDDSSADDEWNYPYTPDQVMSAIQQLTPAYKAVFNLYAIENYSHKEIADILNVSVGTSKSNYLKAKARLRTILEKNFTTNLTS